MSRNAGRFNTSTKVKITTPYGSILKVINYYEDEEPTIDFKIRPKCSICGGNVGCVCFNEENSDDPEQDATDGLQREWVCDKTHCVFEFMKNTEAVKELIKKYGDDEYSIVEELKENYLFDDGEDIFCET